MPIRPSSRSSQETCEPSPGTSPNARSSKTPPSDSLRLRSTLISSTIARARLGVEAAHGRLVDGREVLEREVGRARARARSRSA